MGLLLRPRRPHRRLRPVPLRPPALHPLSPPRQRRQRRRHLMDTRHHHLLHLLQKRRRHQRNPLRTRRPHKEHRIRRTLEPVHFTPKPQRLPPRRPSPVPLPSRHLPRSRRLPRRRRQQRHVPVRLRIRTRRSMVRSSQKQRRPSPPPRRRPPVHRRCRLRPGIPMAHLRLRRRPVHRTHQPWPRKRLRRLMAQLHRRRSTPAVPRSR